MLVNPELPCRLASEHPLCSFSLSPGPDAQNEHCDDSNDPASSIPERTSGPW